MTAALRPATARIPHHIRSRRGPSLTSDICEDVLMDFDDLKANRSGLGTAAVARLQGLDERRLAATTKWRLSAPQTHI